MISILAKIFVKGDDEIKTRQKYGSLCSIVGIMLNIILFCGKYFAGIISGSIAITADAFNNLSDAGSSFITLIGFHFSGKKPDPQHPFGHGRIEYISGLIVSIAILLMGFELGKTSVEKIIHPEPIDTSLVAFVILLMSICVKIYMAYYNHSIGKKIDSSAMKATAIDSLSDSVATSVVLIAMLILKFAHINIDGISGLCVALFIIYAGYNSAKETMDPLLGKPADKEFVEKIEQIVMSYEIVSGIHDMVVHDYGPGRCMISLHAEVPGNKDIYEIHDVIDNIEVDLQSKLHCDAVIHMDPIDVDNELVNELKEKVYQKIQLIDKKISIHDFRMVHGQTHTNIIFDAVIPMDSTMTEQELKKAIEDKVSTIDGNINTIVSIDRPYV